MPQYASPATVKRLSTVIFTPQSSAIDFPDWISLLTLCVAPIIMHIVAGAPSTVHLHYRPPAWHDKICHYNPTSILWRYFAILDRRIRAKAWDSADMAASNASFWTERGWDGSESIMEKSRKSWTRLPNHARIDIFSASAAKTIVVALQGAQAIYILLKRFSKNPGEFVDLAMDSIFFPVAVFGLLRLPASLWLTDDYAFADIFSSETLVVPNSNGAESELTGPPKSRRLLRISLLSISPDSPPERYYPFHSWRGVAVRIFFLLPILGLWVLSMDYLQPWGGGTSSSTNFVAKVFYLSLLSFSLIIMATFFILGSCRTTVIPCIGSVWYKVYTCVVYSMMLGVIIVAALESRRTWCGKYTCFPPDHDAQIQCIIA